MDLGPCVTVRSRKDGTVRLRFDVRRNRPDGWKPSIPILVDGRDSLKREALAQKRTQIVTRAENLFRELELMRAQEAGQRQDPPVPEDGRTWRKLIQLRCEHGKWLDLAFESKRTYSSTHRRILELFEGDPALLPSVVTDSQIDKLVRARVASKYRRRAIMIELRVLLRKAMREGWRNKELEIEVYGRRPTPRMRPWTVDELRCLVTSALTCGEPGVARLLLTQWEIGQRLQSVRNFRYGYQYVNGCFSYKCVKTERDVRIEVTNPRARRILDEGYRHGDYMFPSEDGRPFTGRHLCKVFARIRNGVPNFDPKVQLRQLRHTVVLELALAGCTIPEIASITSHAMQTVHRVLEHYLPRVSELAEQAVAKRELRRQLNAEGMRGEVIVEGARRIFLGELPKAALPAPPADGGSDAG